MQKLKEKGITLVALVVTIIVLLILAGIAISLTIGNNGLFSRAGDAVEKHEEAEAREKLELALANIVYDKNIKQIDDEYIDRELEKEGMAVIGDVVIVSDWQFTIDRSVPKIGISLGKGSQNEAIKIASDVKVRDDYVNATMKLDLTYTEGNIKEIIVNGDSKEVPDPVNGVYSLEDIVTENGIYTVIAKDEEGNYKIEKAKVTNITEDMEIWNKADMESFRDKVNSGRTFEGRTARVMDDIDLAGNESDKWTPIGTDTVKFKGTLEGNYHNIDHLYINENKTTVGFFTETTETTKIQNITFTNVNINNNGDVLYTGVVCGINYGIIEQCAVKSGTVESKRNTSDNNIAGGITGYNKRTVKNSYNLANITASTTNKTYRWALTGGICGMNESTIENCYNGGTIISMHEATAGKVAAGGICGFGWNGLVKKCYNIGEINYKNGAEEIQIAGIIGRNGDNKNEKTSVQDSYFLATKTNYLAYNCNGLNQNVYTAITENSKTEDEMKNAGFVSDLGDAFISDVQNADGIWKYNNGYPILKWQIIKYNK